MFYFLHRLKQLENDKTSGSVAILDETIEALKAELDKSHDAISSKDLKEQLINGLLSLFHAHRHFLGLFHFVNEFFLAIEKSDPKFLQREMLNFITAYREKWQNTAAKMDAIVLSQLDFKSKKILLHSQSQTIKTLFNSLAQRNALCNVVQTESRPNNEGKKQAQYLAEKGFRVEYIVDAAVAHFISRCDFALLGADSIYNHEFLNKIGSHPIALACKAADVPLYVISDSRKIVNQEKMPQKFLSSLVNEREKPQDEVWERMPDNIKAPNFYFEKVPNELVTSFILEDGFIAPAKLMKHIEDMEISPYFEQEINTF